MDTVTELSGGNMSRVYKNEGAVYRDLKPQSNTIHRLLQHLENKGVSFTPRFLGLQDTTQEVLSFVEGNTLDDYPAAHDMEQKCLTVRLAAELLRQYHDATLDFKRLPDDIWFLQYDGPLKQEVICHNDFAPYNVTFQEHTPIGIIDFDTACPGPRIWDVAYAAYRFVPLGIEVYDPKNKEYRKYHKEKDANERRILLHEFLSAYGMDDTFELLRQVLLRLEALVALFDWECKKGNAAFLKMKEEGHQDFYRNEIIFIKESMADWI
ncbi:aminoglycoside phosphotransferase family protein [Lacrimispora xylanolytica]|uniref:Aminoglycoside phosphotransferase family protein n=1 Tax=Lacrimispora xylanolytica TaxID=29375 RepID=A0ABY7AFH9_9FIRM|nr:aminoglycoside phosphotransferase family protein [Lacrimispora xylanolytica]WAJ25346.1 aminoglycoside phosphotransferase family protein [Lacrimispora xylanolytica]